MAGTRNHPDLRRLRESLAEPLAQVIADYERHLRLERNLSQHTVRAYLGDVVSLVAITGIAELDELDIAALRSWLASQRADGASRTTLARRSAAARTFTAWAHRRGHLTMDPGIRLATQRPHRTLPAVLRPEQAGSAIHAAELGAAEGDPIALRDHAVLEVLYATGIRVSELCGIDLEDIDHSRRVLRVLGKGNKQRTVPYGIPAERAVDGWLDRDGPHWSTGVLERPCSWALAAAGWTSESSGGWCTMRSVPCPVLLTWVRMDCGIVRRHTCWKAALTSGRFKSCSVTLRSLPPSSTPTSLSSG